MAVRLEETGVIILLPSRGGGKLRQVVRRPVGSHIIRGFGRQQGWEDGTPGVSTGPRGRRGCSPARAAAENGGRYIRYQ